MLQPYNDKRPSIPAEIRRIIEVEAGHSCSVKECHEHTYLEVHHIDHNRENNKTDNLILLCDKHHKMAHAGIIDRKSLQLYKQLLLKTTKRVLPEWTAYQKVEAKTGFPLNAKSIKVQYKLWHEDQNIPLIIRIAPDAAGLFYQELSGPSGMVKLNVMEPQAFYVSFSNPALDYEISVNGYEF